MAHHPPSRWLAPLALLVALVAVWVVVQSTTGDGEKASTAPSRDAGTGGKTSTGSRTATTGTTTAATGSGESPSYTVKAGDTLGTIAETTGVPIDQLLELNPELDPQSLSVGQRIRLRR
jgi:LysM repeat protein